MRAVLLSVVLLLLGNTVPWQALALDAARPAYGIKPDLKSIRSTYQSMAVLQQQLAAKPPGERIELINRFFNRFANVSDQRVWGKSEFWATPKELLTAMAGDCEDIAVAKYFALINSGIDEHQLHLAHVKAYIHGHTAIQEHLVLLYRQDNQTELVLDNLTDTIKPLPLRQDLVHLYSFNRYGVWNRHNRATITQYNSSHVLANWRTMLARFDRQ